MVPGSHLINVLYSQSTKVENSTYVETVYSTYIAFNSPINSFFLSQLQVQQVSSSFFLSRFLALSLSLLKAWFPFPSPLPFSSLFLSCSLSITAFPLLHICALLRHALYVDCIKRCNGADTEARQSLVDRVSSCGHTYS